jgi:GNAT superfamily N-acetyltransferase
MGSMFCFILRFSPYLPNSLGRWPRIHIRRLKESDLHKEFRTGFESFDTDEDGEPFTLSKYLHRDEEKGYETYVLTDEEEICGIVSFQVRNFTNIHDTLYLSRVGVAEHHGGKGYGARLMAFILETCYERGVVIMCCEAVSEAAPFFVALGWEELMSYNDPHWGDGCKTLIFRIPR